MTDRKKTLLHLMIGIAGAMAGFFCVISITLNANLLMKLPLIQRKLSMILIYWIIAVVPIILMLAAKDKPSDYGFSKEKLLRQILIGVLIGLCMSFVLTLLPILAGKGDWVSNGRRYQYLWEFIYDFAYFICAVSLTEEFIFRGFIYRKIRIQSNSDTAAAMISSILFGLFHFMGGNVVQLIMTGLIGLFLCLCRMKIKNCTLLSLIIAHGIYDALITVWGCVF